jgi:hypothetical protein
MYVMYSGHEWPNTVRASFWYAAAVVMLINFYAATLAQEVTVSGRVIDMDTGEPIPIAKVWVYGSAGQLAKGPEAVSLGGEFEIVLNSYRGGAVRCEISAEPIYEKRRITLPITNGRADAGQVKMTRTRTLKLSLASLSRSANGRQQFLDVIATNESSRAITASAVRLVGSAKKQTNCADTTPGVIFEIQDIGEGGGKSSATITIPERSFRDQIAIDGQLTFLGCSQVRMDFSIPWKVQIAPNESMKLRVTLPRRVKQKTGPDSKLLELEKWEVVLFRVQLESGRFVETGVEMK